MAKAIPIELFSLENVALGIFGVVTFIDGVLAYLPLVVPEHLAVRRWASILADRIDAMLIALFHSAKVIPWLLGALLISILAPIYDMYADANWADEVLKSEVPGLSWPEIVRNSHRRTLPTLMHVAQTAILLLVLWIYSILWLRLIVNSTARAGFDASQRSKRLTFAVGFIAFVMTPTSLVINYLGKHAEIALRLPTIATP